MGFFAIDPTRGAGLHFTAPYVLITGSYLVKETSPLKDNSEVDRKGTRLIVSKDSAYDLYLTRIIKNATIIRAPSCGVVVETFIKEGYEVAGGVTQALQLDVKKISGLRILPGNFMVIQQAMGMPKSRSEEAITALRDFVEEMKRKGFVDESL